MWPPTVEAASLPNVQMWSKAVHEAGEEEERPVHGDCNKQVDTAPPLSLQEPFKMRQLQL